MNTVANLQEIQALIERGAVFYVSHSGGKDSQAMYAAICKIVPYSQIRVIHADLGVVEHQDVKYFIGDNLIHGGGFQVAKAFHKDGRSADFFSLVRNRRASLDAKGQFDAPAFPSSAARFCTSDLKTGPIWREIRAGYKQLVVNCVGIRAQESKSRAKKVANKGTLNFNTKNNNSVREAYDWWPIADWSIDQVWAEIAEAGQTPHPAYAAGNERLSCAFCIFGSKNDLRNAAAQRPELLDALSQLEIEVRTTMFAGETLAQRISH